MNQMYHSDLVVNVLRKEYPEIANTISEKIQNTLPEKKLSDLSQVDVIVSSFLQIKGIQHFTWKNEPGKERITNTRELLLAVILMFYHPEKLHGFDTANTRNKVVKYLTVISKSSQPNISRSMVASISAYKTYSDFRSEVNGLYEQIKNDVKF